MTFANTKDILEDGATKVRSTSHSKLISIIAKATLLDVSQSHASVNDIDGNSNCDMFLSSCINKPSDNAPKQHIKNYPCFAFQMPSIPHPKSLLGPSHRIIKEIINFFKCDFLLSKTQLLIILTLLCL